MCLFASWLVLLVTISDISHLTLALPHQRAILVPLYAPFRRTRHEILRVMLERGLEPDGLVRIFEEPVPASVEALDSYRFPPAQLGGALHRLPILDR